MVHVSTTAEIGEVSVRALRDVAVLDVLQEVKFEGCLRQRSSASVRVIAAM